MGFGSRLQIIQKGLNEAELSGIGQKIPKLVENRELSKLYLRIPIRWYNVRKVRWVYGYWSILKNQPLH